MKILLKALAVTPVVAGVAISAQAADMSSLEKADAIAIQATVAGQVTSISQLSDVKPTDWAFQALQSLVERYGCIVGYPSKTYQGNKALSRYEFAAGLNACIDKVTEYAASKEDLETLKQLMQEFQAELATLRGRVDRLESKVAELQAQQFSTTTKLQGDVILSLDQAYNPSGTNTGVSFASKVSLGFNTSFTGRDILRTTLVQNNILSTVFRGGRNAFPVDGTAPSSSLAYDNYGSGNPASGNFYLEKLYYKFPINNLTITVGTSGLQAKDVLATTGTFYSPVISNFFGISDPGVYGDTPASGAAGGGFNWQLSKNFNLGVSYIAQNGAVNGTAGGRSGTTPAGTNGLFATGQQLTAQLAFMSDTGTFLGAIGYAWRNGNSATSAPGNNFGQYTGGVNFGSYNAFDGNFQTNNTSNNLAVTLGWAISPGFTLNGSYGIGWASSFTLNQTIQSWKIASTFPNLFAKGNEFGVAVGAVPWVSDASDIAFRDQGNFAFEAYYRFQITDNISITPGVYLITNQEQYNSSSINTPVAGGTSVIPVLKTQFKF